MDPRLPNLAICGGASKLELGLKPARAGSVKRLKPEPRFCRAQAGPSRPSPAFDIAIGTPPKFSIFYAHGSNIFGYCRTTLHNNRGLFAVAFNPAASVDHRLQLYTQASSLRHCLKVLPQGSHHLAILTRAPDDQWVTSSRSTLIWDWERNLLLEAGHVVTTLERPR